MFSTVFKPGVEVVFHYGAQVTTGIPNSGSQVGGFAVNATVKTQFIRNDKIIVAVSGRGFGWSFTASTYNSI